jgi:hypothetical protein
MKRGRSAVACVVVVNGMNFISLGSKNFDVIGITKMLIVF